MTSSSDSHRVTFIVLRFMRRPILLLVSIYAISMVGWVLIPGVNVDGKPEPLSFFHAFYFLTYTATTTGFGEIPYAFSDAQRMWSIVSLYAGVVAWLYAVGSIIHLLQNTHFRRAIEERRFAKSVSRIREPFVIICGFGNTGSLLARGLSDAGITAVILDRDDDRIKALHLRDYRVTMRGLCADARVPVRLTDAGLLRPNCKAVVALTPDEDVNLKISVIARLLNPGVEVITQSTSETYEETLATLGEGVHIVDPFQTFARYLGATVKNPAVYALNRWLVSAPGANLDEMPRLPRGKWILCGYGRMGRRIREALEASETSTVTIDPNVKGAAENDASIIVERANQKALAQAGVAEAEGIVAGTDNDAYNLSILLNARAMNPHVFSVVRQNRHLNETLFNAAGADLIMQPSLVSARRILFLLIAPLLKPFFERVRESRFDSEDAFLESLFQELRNTVGSDVRPRIWTVDVSDETTSALAGAIRDAGPVTLADILKDPSDRGRRLACVALVAKSGNGVRVMPELSHSLELGEQILFCGRNGTDHLLDATLNNEYTLRYLMTGVDEVRGIFMRWIARRFGGEADVRPVAQG